MTTIKRFTPDYKMHAVRFEAFAREAEHGELVQFDDHQQVVSAVEAERDALAGRAISIVEDAANQIACAVFNLSGKSLDDLPLGLCDMTSPTDSALLAERRLRAFATELREAK
ncbi:Uncharacterised protein [Serratia marcescens]|uniref:hypothetical protein n=1 Tax=Serratia marcescens TaxID=615 RepID=UPI000744E118|nr:hypothetical protein [Serratia marcescens]CVG58520.1 Uncharacterised protein [Serratia marcescens]